MLAQDPEDSSNQVIKFNSKVNASNVRWYLGDTFDGSFKIKLRVKAEDFYTTTNKQSLRIQLYNSENKEILRTGLALPASSGVATGEYQMQTYIGENSSGADSKKAGSVEMGENGKYTTEWMNIELIGDAQTNTTDVRLNGVETHTDWPFYTSDATKCDVSRIEFTKREDYKTNEDGTTTVTNDATVYIDDVEIYSHKIFTGTLPSGEEVLVGQNSENLKTQIKLELSDESMKTLDMSLTGVDSSVLGTVSAQGTIAGFDDAVSVNAKVCNYHINALGFKENGEYISAPKANGTVSDAIFTNVGSYTQAKAVFAWYNSSGKLESSKIVDLSAIEPGETEKTVVDLQLPESLEGGMLKVFVLDSLSNITPIDISALFTSFTATAPTVYMTGDSTTCNYKVTRFPEAGVGQMFGDYLNGASVVNMARSGLSSQTFIDNGYWDTIMNNVKPGDYIFITFGHNDLDDGTFQINIPRFAEEAAEKNANVIMYSPVARRLEALKGTAWNGFNYGGQMDFMKKYCTDNGIPYIDMTTLSQNHIRTLGEEDSAQLYMVDVYSNYANYASDERWIQSVFNTEQGRIEQKLATDNSHFTFYGADTWAQMLAKEIKNMNLVLSDYIVNEGVAITYPNID